MTPQEQQARFGYVVTDCHLARKARQDAKRQWFDTLEATCDRVGRYLFIAAAGVVAISIVRTFL